MSDAEWWTWFAVWRAEAWAAVARVRETLDKAGV